MGAPILALFWLGRWFSKIAAAARKPFTITAAQRRRAFAAPETDSSASHCILWIGAGLRRKRVPQNESNHNSHDWDVRIEESWLRTHPGLEKRETWGTHRYLILLPKI